MAITVKLNELIQQPENAILSISTLLGQKLALLDCSGVVAVTPEQLTLLFTAIPETWQSTEIKEVFDFSTITPTFNHQLQDWINQRLGYIQPQTSITDYELTSTNDLDIFNFRNEVIGDYRRYIESFLKIRDRKVKEFVDAELDKGNFGLTP
ncbi:hypothetical protein [Nostoc sp. KVJ3]|uniref:hypothetical protein n=1 Tax=Nostoc sp. KVJ3 TaxID=457945 RepID=UPI0022388098|nr:hypothetical protein [Nostoc sp. KVJ3]